MYRGLDVATAKVSEREKQGVPHHLLDVVDPTARCDVLEFKRRALAAVDDILARGKVPVVVGGTMYYTQSILWRSQVLDDVPTRAPAQQQQLQVRLSCPVLSCPIVSPVLSSPVFCLPSPTAVVGRHSPAVSVSEQDDLTPAEMFARLQEVDPEMARRLHVHNTRKVRRSLQVFYQTGVPHSELLARQEREPRDSQRYFDACALWVHASPPVLAARLETRVDEMLAAGLVDEIKALRALVKAHHPPPRVGATDEPDASVGILQAIGYKEFQPYFDALEAAESLGDGGTGDAPPPDVDAVLRECVEQLNVATRQYARRQLSWIRNKFVTKDIPVYQVDSSDVDAWDERVARPAIDIASRFLSGEAIAPAYRSVQELRPEAARGRSLADKFAENECAVCGGRKFLGDTQWREHLSSKGHRYHMKRVELERAGVTRGHKNRRSTAYQTEVAVDDGAGGASTSDSISKGDDEDADAAETLLKRHKAATD